MNTSSNGYVLGFAVTVCVTISAMLAATATSLGPMQQEAAELDRQKNVMMAAGLLQAGETKPQAELRKLYDERIKEVVVDTESGKVLDGKAAGDADKLNKEGASAARDPAAKKKAEARYRVVAQAKGTDGKATYVLPISGKGLWSTIYGYLALGEDASTVKGVTFYKHGETPGLGGECENPEWMAKWDGKSILDDSKKLVGVIVKKGAIDPAIPEDKRHKVDGLSGATITCNGITKFVKNDLTAFESYLASVRQ
ncbi:MAG: NADH:ubiquinone reductase (Na(+)-transporting) subunit C [Planctomycetota bacterium]